MTERNILITETESPLNRVGLLKLPLFKTMMRTEAEAPGMWPMYDGFIQRTEGLLHLLASMGGELAIRGGQLEIPWLDPGGEVDDWGITKKIWDNEWPIFCLDYRGGLFPVLPDSRAYIYGSSKLGFVDAVLMNQAQAELNREEQIAFYNRYMRDLWHAYCKQAELPIEQIFPLDRSFMLDDFHPALALAYDALSPNDNRLTAGITPIEELKGFSQFRLTCSSDFIGVDPAIEQIPHLSVLPITRRTVDLTALTVTMWHDRRNFRQHGFNLDQITARLYYDRQHGKWFVDLPLESIETIDYSEEDLEWWECQIQGLEDKKPEALNAAHFFIESLCRAVRKTARYNFKMFPGETLEGIRSIVGRIIKVWETNPPSETLLRIMETDINAAHFCLK